MNDILHASTELDSAGLAPVDDFGAGGFRWSTSRSGVDEEEEVVGCLELMYVCSWSMSIDQCLSTRDQAMNSVSDTRDSPLTDFPLSSPFAIPFYLEPVIFPTTTLALRF
jgi:hypothetical protein